MATYYIDPSSTVNGNGLSETTPFNTWNSVTWVFGNTYLQRQGTIFNGKVSITSGGLSEDTRIYLDVYGPQVLPLRDGLAFNKAKINSTGYDRCVQISTGAHYITINNFDIYGADTKTSPVRGITVGSSTASRANYITIKNCSIHDIGSNPVLAEDENGIQVFGDNFKIYNSEIYNIADDGIWAQGNNFEAGYVNIHNIATSNRIAGDCIQLDNSLGTSSNYWVHHCILDHSNVEMKQCFIDSVGINGSVGGIFEFNTCTMGLDNFQADTSKNINIGNPNSIIRSNTLIGGWAGFWLVGNNIKCYGNIVKNFKRTGVLVNAGTSGISIYNNSFYSDRVDKIVGSRAVEVSSTAVTANITNNAASGSGVDYVLVCSKTNASTNGIIFESNKGQGATSFASVNGGVPVSNTSINPDWNTVTLIPNSNSPLIGSGLKYWAGARPNDLYGEPLPDTAIDIGAVQSTGNANHPKNLINSSNPSATAMDLITYSPTELQVQLDKVNELNGRVDVLEALPTAITSDVVANGTTDDTTVLNAELQLGVVTLPPGKLIRITNALDVKYGLIGNGSTIILDSSTAQVKFAQDFVLIKDIKIRVNTASTVPALESINYKAFFSIENVFIHEWSGNKPYIGAKLYGLSGSIKNLRIDGSLNEGLWIYNVTTSNPNAIVIDGARIRNCASYCIKIEGATQGPTIISPVMEGTGTLGLHLVSTFNSTIINPYFELANGSVNIRLTGSGTNTFIGGIYSGNIPSKDFDFINSDFNLVINPSYPVATTQVALDATSDNNSLIGTTIDDTKVTDLGANNRIIEGKAGGKVNLLSGSASLPAIKFFVDATSGLYRSGANAMSWACSGIEKVKYTVNGIQVLKDSGTAGDVYVQVNDANTTSRSARYKATTINGTWEFGPNKASGSSFDVFYGTDEYLRFTAPADGETGLLLRRNVGGSFTLQRVSMGAADSAGTGYKVLRVPN